MSNGKPDTRQLVHGWLILDKPQGLTSTQALGRARRLVGGKKAGHGGTLDPLATGILPLAFGEATKLIPYVMDGDKEYEFTLRWGEARDTDDAEGKATAFSDKRPTEQEIREALPLFTGLITQTPPVYSAIKCDGERAYDLARDGVAVEMQPRQVTVHSLELLASDKNEQDNSLPLAGRVREGGDKPGNTAQTIESMVRLHSPSPDPSREGRGNADFSTFRVRCGKGMYVRALARDLAVKLGTYAHVTVLRRTRVGSFGLDQAVTLEKLETLGAAALLDLSAALSGVPFLELAPHEAQQLRNGMGILIRPHHGDLLASSPIFARHQGLPVALVEAKAGEFRVLRGFHF